MLILEKEDAYYLVQDLPLRVKNCL